MGKIRKVAAPYAQIAHALRSSIYAGDIQPGDRLPSVRSLAEQYEVSTATADKALSVLRSEGLAVAVPGVGTHVAEQALSVQTGGVRFRRMMHAGQATRPGERSEIETAGLAPAPEAVADALGIQAGTAAVCRRRRFYDEAGLSALSTSWLRAELAEAVPALLGTRPIPGGTIGAVAEATGRQPTIGVDTAEARIATDDEAAAFGIAQPAAVLVVEARLLDAEGEVIECGTDVIAPGRPWPVSYDLS